MNNTPKTIIDLTLEKLAAENGISAEKVKEAFLPPVGSTFVIYTFVYRVVSVRTSPMKIHAIPIAVYEPKKQGFLKNVFKKFSKAA